MTMQHADRRPIDQPDGLFTSVTVGSPDWWQQVGDAGTPLLLTSAPTAVQQLMFLWRQPANQQTAAVVIEVFSATPHPCDALTLMQHWPDSDVWYWSISLPADWCGSYRLVPLAKKPPIPLPGHRQQQRQWWLQQLQMHASSDPFNPLPGYGHGCQSPLSRIDLAATDPHTIERPLQGQLQTLEWVSIALGNRRTVACYQTVALKPLEAESATSTPNKPLILLLDGQWWLNELPVLADLDRLTAAGHLPAAIYLLVDSLDNDVRYRELGDSQHFWQALMTELLPTLPLQACVHSQPLALVAGQSLGGLAALYAHLHWPHRFAAALSQSGSFWWPNPDYAAPAHPTPEQAPVIRQVAQQQLPLPHIPRRVWLQCGEYEAGMDRLSRSLHNALHGTGHRSHFETVRGGHDRACWYPALLSGLCRHFQLPDSCAAAPCQPKDAFYEPIE